MRFRSYMTAGALTLVPVLALAGEAAVPSAQPMFVNVNGQAVPVRAQTHVVQTASGPMKVSTWSWQSPQGGASFRMESSTGGAPSADAIRQIQAMQTRMRAAQAQMIAMQQIQHMQNQMFALRQAALMSQFAPPTPQAVVFAAPLWAMPDAVVIIPAQRAMPPAAPSRAAPGHAPGVDI